jgi:hypothetical protein
MMSTLREERILRGLEAATCEEQMEVLRRRIAMRERRGSTPPVAAQVTAPEEKEENSSPESIEMAPASETVATEIAAVPEPEPPTLVANPKPAHGALRTAPVPETMSVEKLMKRFDLAMANNLAGRNKEARKMDPHTAWHKAMSWIRKQSRASDLPEADRERVREHVMAKKPGHPPLSVERTAGLLEAFTRRNLAQIMARQGDKVERDQATAWATRDAVAELMKITLGDERLDMAAKGSLLTFLEENAAPTFDSADRAKHWFDRALEEVREHGRVLTRKERRLAEAQRPEPKREEHRPRHGKRRGNKRQDQALHLS